jgi:LPXTG-motif cell wall-anchored protein
MEREKWIQDIKKKLNIVILILLLLLLVLLGVLVGRTIKDESFSVVYHNFIESHSEETAYSQGIFRPVSLSIQSGLFRGYPVVSAGTTATHKTPDIELYQGQERDNQPFQVHNMVPGDSITQTYSVKVYHKGEVTLNFHTLVTEQTKDLADVLEVKVVQTESDTVLCDGTFSQLENQVFSQELPSPSGDSTIRSYEITVSLDTSVGNPYQLAMLMADFEWYVNEDTSPDDGSGGAIADGSQDNKGDNNGNGNSNGNKNGNNNGSSGGGKLIPKTGDRNTILLWSGVGIACLILLLVLLGRRKKEEKAP